MKKKLIAMFFAAVIVVGLVNQVTTHAENRPPDITRVTPGTFVALNLND